MTTTNPARLGWVILYVSNPAAAAELYARAFGMSRRFVAEGNSYPELDSGSTTLAVASEELADGNLPDGFQRPDPDRPPFNVERALVSTTSRPPSPAPSSRRRRWRTEPAVARSARNRATVLGCGSPGPTSQDGGPNRPARKRAGGTA